MAISTKAPRKKTSASAKAKTAGNADVTVQPDTAADQKAVDEDTASEDDSSVSGEAVSSEKIEHAEAKNLADPTTDTAGEETVAPVDADTTESEGVSSGELPDIENNDYEDDQEQMEPDRTEEVPALLGGSDDFDTEESEIVPDQDATDDDATSLDGGEAEEVPEIAATPTMPIVDLPDNQPLPALMVESGNTTAEHPAADELKNILESMKDSLADTQYISVKIDAVANDTECLIKQVNIITAKYDLLTVDMESHFSGANTKNIFSKTYLTISSLLLALLVISQVYMFISMFNAQRLQNAAGSSVLENMSRLNKKLADYDKNITNVLEKPAQQEHAQPNPAATEKAGHEPREHAEIVSTNFTPVRERLNKLRNGLPEKKLIRKETGDWFVINKKSEECISDLEVIEVLNQAYRKIGRPLSPNVPIPPHNAVCILKPDGKGGTEVVMTKDFLP
jgi:hypothetical protein